MIQDASDSCYIYFPNIMSLLRDYCFALRCVPLHIFGLSSSVTTKKRSLLVLQRASGALPLNKFALPLLTMHRETHAMRRALLNTGWIEIVYIHIYTDDEVTIFVAQTNALATALFTLYILYADVIQQYYIHMQLVRAKRNEGSCLSETKINITNIVYIV